MKQAEADTLLDYMRIHFEEIEALLKMGLVQSILNELGAGGSDLHPEREEKIILQAAGREWDVNDCRSRVIADYISSSHAVHTIKNLTIYLKPEDQKAYYVVNGKYCGSVDLFNWD